MNARLATRAKRLLLCAATSLFVAQPARLAVASDADGRTQMGAAASARPAPLPARDPRTILQSAVQRELSGEPAEAAPATHSSRSVPPSPSAHGLNSSQGAIQQTAGTAAPRQPAPPQQPGAPVLQSKSEVMQHLELLYARDGRSTPQTNMNSVPHMSHGPKRTAPGSVVPHYGATHHHRARRPSLLQRIFGRGSRRTAAAAPRPVPRQVAAPSGGWQMTVPPAPAPSEPHLAGNGQPRLLPGEALRGSAPLNNAFPSPHPQRSAEAAATHGAPAAGDAPREDLKLVNQADTPGTPTIEPQSNPADDHKAKFQRIAEREGAGLKGFCPVALRDERDLVDATAEFSSEFGGRTFHFVSAEAKARFDAEPAKYAPARGGIDVILLESEQQSVEGRLDHAVWFRDRLYLFSSRESKDAFVRDPASYAIEGLED